MAESVVEYQLSWEWAVRAVPAGLVLYRLAEPRRSWGDRTPDDPRHVDLYLDAEPGFTPPDDMLAALGRFADEMPAGDRARLRVRVPSGVSPAVLRMIHAAVPAPQLAWERSAEQETPSTAATPMAWERPRPVGD